MDKQPVVTVENVTKTYGKQGEKQTPALKGVSFQVEPGEFVGIMGASGSGKTTLLNILSTLDTPTSGSVRIKGADVTKLKGDALSDFRAKKIGFIFQDFNLLENLTGRETLHCHLPCKMSALKSKPKPLIRSRKRLALNACWIITQPNCPVVKNNG
ncbi:ABC transporter, ATPase component [Lacticaseibacillus rhamnosus Lc 705]|nr:ABC transporter, ATPase component [Lacticaseibacillus rhamnosus Lc 705]